MNSDSDLETAFSLPAVDPRQPSRRRILLRRAGYVASVLVGGALLSLAMIAGLEAAAPDDRSIAGQVVLTGENVSTTSPCHGVGDYRAIREGAQVVLTDEAGTTMRLAKLGPAKAYEPGTCTFAFAIPEVPGRDFFGIEIANAVKVQYANADLAGPVTITLGD
jgi:hypothetical protein